MANFDLSIDLLKYWGARIITTKNGEEVVVIPIEANKFKRTSRGGLLSYLKATEKKQIGQYGDTHFVKPRFTKDAFASLTDEQRDSIPFVGSVYYPTPHVNNGGGYGSQTPYAPTTDIGDIPDSIF